MSSLYIPYRAIPHNLSARAETVITNLNALGPQRDATIRKTIEDIYANDNSDIPFHIAHLFHFWKQHFSVLHSYEVMKYCPSCTADVVGPSASHAEYYWKNIMSQTIYVFRNGLIADCLGLSFMAQLKRYPAILFIEERGVSYPIVVNPEYRHYNLLNAAFENHFAVINLGDMYIKHEECAQAFQSQCKMLKFSIKQTDSELKLGDSFSMMLKEFKAYFNTKSVEVDIKQYASVPTSLGFKTIYVGNFTVKIAEDDQR